MTKLDMRNQTIGVEIEMTGITRKQTAEIIAEHTNGYIEAKHNGGYTVTGQDGRTWDVKYDISVTPHYRPAPGQKMQPFGYGSESYDKKEWRPEIASPILTYEDIPMLQELVRKLFAAGGRSSAALGCGIHIHVGADKHDARSLRNLVNIIASKQELLYQALEVTPSRETSYAAKVKSHLVNTINTIKPREVNGLGRSIQNIMSTTGTDRYHGLNLQAIWKLGTVEWRLFNGTLHAGKIKAYIQLALAISAQAINQRSASAAMTITDNPAYTFRTWLLRLGLNGDEFKTAREHLLKPLPGNKAWRNGHAA